MSLNNYLFEIGIEELPSNYIVAAENKFAADFKKQLIDKNIDFEDIKSFSTPRRLAVMVVKIAENQKDVRRERIGPSVKVAYQNDGSLSKAGLGFLKGCRVNKDDVIIKKTEKGEYISVIQEIKGRASKEILPDICLSSLDSIEFPKNMKWKNKSQKFARPIRWLVSLWNSEVLEFTYFDIIADRVTYGNRFFSVEPISIDNTLNYSSILQHYFVIPDRKERFLNIRKQLESLSRENFRVDIDEKLLSQVNCLIEYPTAVSADFSPKYLNLPQEVIVSTLKENQKYFIVRDDNGKITPNFVFVSNGNPEYSDLVKYGNQKVVKARLEDAEFYFNEDIKKPFEEFTQLLKDVTFHEKLGSLYDKTHRISVLSEFMADLLKLTDLQKKNIKRIAKLCKADLVTLMLGEKEFTGLQGYIGMHYAIISGEDEVVCKGINDHYLPKSFKGNLPETVEGSVVAIADKMDTVCGIIMSGIIPSGSQDPFALRRAANGILLIMKEFNFPFHYDLLVNKSVDLVKEQVKEEKKLNETIGIIRDFFKQRLSWFLESEDIQQDIINSVIELDFSTINQLLLKAKTLQQFKEKSNFYHLVKGFKRVTNIIEKSSGDTHLSDIDRDLFEDEAEKNLFNQLEIAEEKVREDINANQFENVCLSLINMSNYIDSFFDNVMVNANNPDIRNNRYALLIRIRKLFLKIADISKINYENE